MLMKICRQLVKATRYGEVVLRAFCLYLSCSPAMLGRAADSVALWPSQQAKVSLFYGAKWLQGTRGWSLLGAAAESGTTVLFPRSWPGMGICLENAPQPGSVCWPSGQLRVFYRGVLLLC